jgi:hypothetical protein
VEAPAADVHAAKIDTAESGDAGYRAAITSVGQASVARWGSALDVEEAIEADAAAIVDALAAAEAGDTDADESDALITGEADIADLSELTELTGLTQRQLAMLEFERHWWRAPGAKEQAIRDRFGISPTRYYQALNSLLDLPQALSYDPTLVHRLQRLRTAAARSRRLT